MWKVLRFPVAIAGVALAALLASDGTLSAASYTVNSTIDAVDANPGDGVCATAAGECTLRAAIQEANALPGAGTIILPSGTYRLSIPGAGEDLAATGDLDITDDLRVDGTVIVNGGAEPASTIDAAGLDRVIHVVGSVSVEMSGVELRNGDVSGEFALGGGLFNPLGSVKFEDGVVRDNSSVNGGGGIYNSGSLTVRNANVTENRSSSGRGFLNGGGIFPSGALLVVADTRIFENTAGAGGGLFNGNDGAMTILTTVIRGNHGLGNGGGIDNIGNLTVVDSTIAGNDAPGGGGGIEHGLEQATLERVTIAGNTGTPGGGIDHGSGNLIITDSTLSGNYSPTEPGPFGVRPGRGGAIRINTDTVNLQNVTIVDNRAAVDGGGIHNILDGTVGVKNTILANNSGDTGVENCTGPVVSTSHNVEDAATCGFTGAGDISGVDPIVGPLGDNGGPTQTHPLLSGSPAIDAGDNGACPATDQRGVARPVDGNGDGVAVCDIGAFEASAGTTAPTASPTPEATPPPNPTVTPEPGSLPAAFPRTGGRPSPSGASPVAGSGAFAASAAALGGLAAVAALRRRRR